MLRHENAKLELSTGVTSLILKTLGLHWMREVDQISEEMVSIKVYGMYSFAISEEMVSIKVYGMYSFA